MSKAKALIDKNLQEYKAKPILPLALAALSELINHTDTTIASFKSLYQQDPVFCWSALDDAFQLTQNRASQPFAVDHAISTIGLGGVRNIVDRYKTQPKQNLSEEVRFYLSSSVLAAELAGNIGELSLGKAHTRWSALIYQMPETILWHIHPKSMWRIHYRRLSLPKNLSLFEESKLGFNLTEWRRSACSFFHLGEHLTRLFDKPIPDNPREILSYCKNGLSDASPTLKEWHRQEEWLVILCNRLARAIYSPWHKNGVARHISLIAQLTGLSHSKLSQLTFHSVRKVSYQLKHSQLFIPAVPMIMLPSNPYFPNWLNDRSVVQLKIAERKNSVKKNTSPSLANIVKKLTVEASSFNNSAELVHFGIKAAIEKLEFSRAIFLSVNRKAKLVETKITLSRTDVKKIRPDFSFATPTPLSKFLEQQALMLVDSQTHKRIWQKLPVVIQKNTDRFVLFSVKPGKQIRALIYVDSSNEQAFSAKNFNQLKLLLKALNKGLAIRNALKQKKPIKRQASQ